MPDCIECGFEITGKKRNIRKFCSRKCVERNGEKKRTKTCPSCNNIFILPKQGDTRVTFCSVECRSKDYSGPKNHAYNGIKRNLICENCKESFQIRTSRQLKARFCSIKCRDAILKGENHPLFENIMSACEYCQKEIRITKRKLGKRVFCDRGCANRAHSLFIKGKSNPRFLHGLAGTGRYSSDYLNIREKVRQRDGNLCMLCGQTSIYRHLDVHHIDYDIKNNSLDNLLSLCKTCHGKMHGTLEQRAAWKEKLLNLLKSSEKKALSSI